MTQLPHLNFQQFKNVAEARLKQIPDASSFTDKDIHGVMSTGSVGFAYHHWKAPESVKFDKVADKVPLAPAQITEIPLNNLHTMQPGISREHVNHYLNSSPTDELPQITQYKGKNWVEDGHHRLAAFMLGGATSSPAVVRKVK